MRKLTTTLAAIALAAGTAFTAAPASAAPGDPAYCLLRAGVYALAPAAAVEVQNVTVEGLPGAQLVGTCSAFTSSNPFFSCLAGSTLNVWRAPYFGSRYVIHNGWQGPQCTYGTWVIQAPLPL